MLIYPVSNIIVKITNIEYDLHSELVEINIKTENTITAKVGDCVLFMCNQEFYRLLKDRLIDLLGD